MLVVKTIFAEDTYDTLQKPADKGVQAVWHNARQHVQGCYATLGWEPFELPGIGTHIVMYKTLGTSR